MMKKVILSIGASLVVITVLFMTASFKSDPGTAIPDFTLRNVDGKMISTRDYKSAKGFIVVFTCNHCPFAKLYTKRLNELSKKYESLAVPLLAINSMDTLLYEEERFSKMKSKAKHDANNFPYLQDASQSVGAKFGADHTPTAFVIWKEDGHWVIKYKGSIDDNGQNPHEATPFIAKAVDELLKGEQVLNPKTESFGCRIMYRK